MQIPISIYDEHIINFEQPYLPDPKYTEIPLPHSVFDIINNSNRILHPHEY